MADGRIGNAAPDEAFFAWNVDALRRRAGCDDDRASLVLFVALRKDGKVTVVGLQFRHAVNLMRKVQVFKLALEFFHYVHTGDDLVTFKPFESKPVVDL